MPERKPVPQFPFERSFAFIVGIDDYDQQGDAPPLQTAVSDARALARVLKQKPHEFSVTLLENPNGAQLRELLDVTIPDLNIGAHDRVLFYFAGHGIADDAEGRPEGYLLPADARLDAVDSFLPMKRLYEALRPLECPHLLLVLDCCFAGAFRWATKERAARPRVPQRITEYRLRRFCEDHAWQVITSTSYYQKAQDVSSLKTRALGKREQLMQAKTDGATEHSPFAKALLEGLAGLADARVGERGDGVITGSELYSFIRDRISEEAAPGSGGEAQKPNHIFLEKDKGGEFIFLHPKHPLNPLPDVERNPYKGLASYDESDQELFFGRSAAIEKLQQLAAQQQFLVISGVSGSGKSSLIKAGLLPELREAGWRILPVLRPGAHPLRSLGKRFREWQVFSLSEASLAALDKEELPEDALANLQAIVGQEAVGEHAFALLLKQALADVRGMPLCLSTAAHRALQSAGISPNLLEKLTGLIDRRFAQEADFWSAVSEATGKQPERDDQLIILAYAAAGLVWQHAEAAPLFPALSSLNPQNLSPLLNELKQQKTVLLIDQYEELITRCQDKQERQQYEELLQALLEGTASNDFKLILTVRADFEPLLDK
ncbi:MAG: caspase family protein, partial [Calditrichaeota bacterium]|nr:caspase family protein [Calditrichota bacterium]